jgi:hypothetical protein
MSTPDVDTFGDIAAALRSASSTPRLVAAAEAVTAHLTAEDARVMLLAAEAAAEARDAVAKAVALGAPLLHRLNDVYSDEVFDAVGDQIMLLDGTCMFTELLYETELLIAHVTTGVKVDIAAAALPFTPTPVDHLIQGLAAGVLGEVARSTGAAA